MTQYIRNFINNEDGAITVDWVVLTAVILGVLFGALITFNEGAMEHAELTSSTLESLDIPNY